MARASKKMDDLPEREAPDFEAMEANERRDQEAAEQLAAAKKIREESRINLAKMKKLMEDKDRRKKEREERERRRAQKQREEEKDDEKEDEDAKKFEEAAAQLQKEQEENKDDDEEPPTFDDSVFEPTEVFSPPLDFSSVQLQSHLQPPGSHSPEELFMTALNQGLAIALYGASAPVLQLLYKVACVQASSYACDELLQHYNTLASGTKPAWCPSLQDICGSLHSIGYTSKVAGNTVPVRVGQIGQTGGPSTSARTGAATDADGDTEMTDAGAGAGPSSTQDSPTRGSALSTQVQRSAASQLGVLLRVLTGILRLQPSHKLVDFTQTNKVYSERLLLSLLELQLVPVLRRSLLTDIKDALKAYVTVWAETDPDTWKTACTQVASKLPSFGPSYLSALHVLRELPRSCAPALQLQQRGLLVLIAHLLKSQASSTTPTEPLHQALHMLGVSSKDLRSMGRTATALWSKCSRAPTAQDREAAAESGQTTVTGRLDYHRLTTVLNCTFLIAWPLIYDAEEPSKTHHDQCQSFVELLKALRPKARTLRPFVKSSFDNLIATLLMMLETELDKGEPTALHEDE